MAHRITIPQEIYQDGYGRWMFRCRACSRPALGWITRGHAAIQYLAHWEREHGS